MFSKNIKFNNFKKKTNNLKNKQLLNLLHNFINDKNELTRSMSHTYQDSYKKKLIKTLKKNKEINLIGMGGSSLGAKAIYSFLKPLNIRFNFFDNFTNFQIKKNKSKVNLIISKSGNTLETISNFNILKKKNDKNIFITDKKESYLQILAHKLKADLIEHNNYIGGRFSVLSEVGMLPSELMGYNPKKFRRFNYLVKNKYFLNALIQNVYNILELIKNKKTNSIILNYDNRSNDFFYWYQQLVAESLGKKNRGILPIVSSMPKDNHSLMQYYLEGEKNNFYTLFFVREEKSPHINRDILFKPYTFLANKSLNDIAFSQFLATEKVFKEKKIPFRTFVVNSRKEEVMGELFTFFILETILLGKALKINAFDQPAVELIKKNTQKILKKNHIQK